MKTMRFEMSPYSFTREYHNSVVKVRLLGPSAELRLEIYDAVHDPESMLRRWGETKVSEEEFRGKRFRVTVEEVVDEVRTNYGEEGP